MNEVFPCSLDIEKRDMSVRNMTKYNIKSTEFLPNNYKIYREDRELDGVKNFPGWLTNSRQNTPLFLAKQNALSQLMRS